MWPSRVAPPQVLSPSREILYEKEDAMNVMGACLCARAVCVVEGCFLRWALSVSRRWDAWRSALPCRSGQLADVVRAGQVCLHWEGGR